MSLIKQGEGSHILAERHRVLVESKVCESIQDVLIVEDLDRDGKRMRAILNMILGPDVVYRRAETLNSAVDCVLERVPDIVFLDDYLQPGDSATETVPYLRRAGYKGHIIVVSGEIDRIRRTELLSIGATDTIHKDDVDASVVKDVLSRLPLLPTDEV